jgi:hypothetical protein
MTNSVVSPTRRDVLPQHAIDVACHRHHEGWLDRRSRRTLELDPAHPHAREHLAGAISTKAIPLDDENLRYAERHGAPHEALEPVRRAYAEGSRASLVAFVLEHAGQQKTASVLMLAVHYSEAGPAALLAELGEPEAIRKEVLGHRHITTTQRYNTHLRPIHEIPAHEPPSDAVRSRIWSRRRAGSPTKTLFDLPDETRRHHRFSRIHAVAAALRVRRSSRERRR